MRLLAALLCVVAACSADPPLANPTDATSAQDAGPDAPPPVPSGCIDSTTSGDHVYTCEGLRVDVRVPDVCQQPGCGLILVLHGDTGSGVLMDAHIRMREKGANAGFIVVAPTGPPYGNGQPGSTWRAATDASVVAIVEAVRDVYRVDAKNIHVTGFSRGAFVTWRLLCDHSALFASFAPGGGGHGQGFGEQTCFTQNRVPARKAPVLFLLGRTDASVGYRTLTSIRDAALADYGLANPTTLASDPAFLHQRWAGNGTVFEVWDHAYETVQNGPFGGAGGHCIPGSTTDPFAAQYAIPCELPNGFTWGDEVLAFFRANPMP